MRIRGSGKDTSGFSGNWSRSDSFKRKHRLGQRVRGVLIKNIPDDMAWVEIDGDRLLAQLTIAHPEGARLSFTIEQLTPNIILKELKGDRHNDGPNVVGQASSFDTARALFEARFIPLIRDSRLPKPYMTSEDFFTLLGTSRELHARYADAVQCAIALTGCLGNEQERFLYQPWLAPETRRQVTFIRQSPGTDLTEVIVEFDHPDMGLVRAEFLHKADRAICKIRMQHMTHSKALMQYLSTRSHPDLSMKTDPPGITKLPQRNHGGIVAERLFRP